MQPFCAQTPLVKDIDNFVSSSYQAFMMEYATQKKATTFLDQEKTDFKPFRLLLKKKWEMVKIVVILYFRNII